MKRYHKKIYFPDENKQKLNQLNNDLNDLDFNYTSHCLENLKYRVLDLKSLLCFIKDLKLNVDDVFEYYMFDDKIQKVCYRVKYGNELDIILVLSNNKTIITIYVNGYNDNHDTLKENLYCRA